MLSSCILGVTDTYKTKDDLAKLDELIFDSSVNIEYYERILLKERDILVHLNKVRKIYELEAKQNEKV